MSSGNQWQLPPDAQIRKERTNWRDHALSNRHRVWGLDCPAVDVDFLLLEFNEGRPLALVEYKAFGAVRPNPNSPTYRALRTLADNSKIPLLIVFYAHNTFWVRVTPVNYFATQVFPIEVVLNEKEYVAALYRMRGLTLPADVATQLHWEKPKGRP